MRWILPRSRWGNCEWWWGVSTHIAVLRLIAVDFDDFDFGRRKSSGRLIFLSCCLALVLIFKVGMSGKMELRGGRPPGFMSYMRPPVSARAFAGCQPIEGRASTRIGGAWGPLALVGLWILGHSPIYCFLFCAFSSLRKNLSLRS